MIEGNHLYPIVDKQKQHSLSQIKAGNKYRPCVQVEPAVRSVHVFNNINDILRMLNFNNLTYFKTELNNGEISLPIGRKLKTFDYEECKTSIFVCTERGCVNDLFYHPLRMGRLYNNNVKSEHGQITQFNIENITIQENLHYDNVKETLDKLGDDWIYSGQSIQRLAHEYYNKHYNQNYKSDMSPQLMDVFNNTLSKNTGFNVTLSKEQ
jgi:hypothetical protein